MWPSTASWCHRDPYGVVCVHQARHQVGVHQGGQAHAWCRPELLLWSCRRAAAAELGSGKSLACERMPHVSSSQLSPPTARALACELRG